MGEKLEYKGYNIEVWQDDYPDDPREWDNLGTMVCFHNRYNLGDKHEFSSPEEVMEHIEKTGAISLNLYLYDHSGISISTRSFVGRAVHAEWDSGQVGVIFVEPEKVRKEYNVKKISKKTREDAIRILEGEVKNYDMYISGEVYGFTVTDIEDNVVDSCGCYFGEDEVIKAAKASIDNNTPEAPKYNKDEANAYESAGW